MDQLSAPPPMTITVVQDHLSDAPRLLGPGWPACLVIVGRLLELARLGQTYHFTYDGEIAQFDLSNGRATYRQIPPTPDDGYWVRDLYLFDCIAYSGPG